MGPQKTFVESNVKLVVSVSINKSLCAPIYLYNPPDLKFPNMVLYDPTSRTSNTLWKLT